MLMQTLNRSPRKLHSHDLRTPPVSLLHSRKKALSPVLVHTGNEQTVVDFMLKDS